MVSQNSSSGHDSARPTARVVFTVTAAALALLLACLTFTSASAQRRPRATEPSSVTVTLPPQPTEAGYVGELRCQSCHRAQLTQFHKTVHSRVGGVDAAAQMNCESCHGPGKAHADGVEAARGDDAAIAAASRLVFAFRGTSAENSARCLSCHQSTARLQRFNHSSHAATGVSCVSCHSAHLVDSEDAASARRPPLAQAQFFQVPQLAAEQRWLRESLLKNGQPALCFSCHQSARRQFAQPFHHRVVEGSMKCSDCHNPHGTTNSASLTAPGWETCTSCHVDKHGPFVFEHAAVRVEGCAVCHDAHGSVSRFMLKRRESRFLCLQCHGDTHGDQVSVPHGRLSFQTRGDCTRCHVAIHGSNFSRDFLQ
jgi:predicted CXXCH cytochrome family protein